MLPSLGLLTPWDNVVVETFFKTLKAKVIWRRRWEQPYLNTSMASITHEVDIRD